MRFIETMRRIESKGSEFVPSLISSQSPIVYVKIGSVDWREMHLRQMSAPWI